MKKRLLFLFSSLFIVSIMSAYSYDGTTFAISSDVTLPVYVQYGGKKITITQRHYTVSIRIPNASITDAYGNDCIYEHRTESSSDSRGNHIHHYYYITDVYSSSQSSSYSSKYNYSKPKKKKNNNRQPYTWNSENMPDFYPNLHLRLGFSPLWGEYADLRLHIGYGMGFTVFGGVGYDWVCYRDRSMPIDPLTGERVMSIDKMTWNAGIGYTAMYIGDFLDLEYDVTGAIIVGRTTTYAPCSMLADFSTTIFVGDTGIFGLFAGVGLGCTLEKHLEFQWDARFGIAINFMQFSWF